MEAWAKAAVEVDLVDSVEVGVEVAMGGAGWVRSLFPVLVAGHAPRGTRRPGLCVAVSQVFWSISSPSPGPSWPSSFVRVGWSSLRDWFVICRFRFFRYKCFDFP